MKFEVKRSLKKKVFSTILARVEEQNDPCAQTEKSLEDDFGPVEVEVGGKFEVFVKKESAETKPTFSKVATNDPKEFAFKFALDSNKQALISNVEIKYECDSNKESPRKAPTDIMISPLEIAQLKCEIFEDEIKSRIETAVTKWKSQQTDFETETIDPFEVHLY